jgi:hypothetical protein
MPTPFKGPRLWLRRREDGPTRWIIRDGLKQIATGCTEADKAEAERVLSCCVSGKPYKRPSEPRAPVVYFITSAERDDGPIKIGWTAGAPITRLRDLQTGSHERLKIIATTKGGAESESLLHRMFRADCLIGEWHRRSDRLMATIADLRAAA